jgi:hypothetical protein
MTCKIKPNAYEQQKAEHRRFLARQKGKPVLADKIEARNNRLKKNDEEKKFLCDIN